MRERQPRILVDALSVANGGGHSYAVNLIRELDRDDRGFSFTFLVPPGRLAERPTSRVRIRPVDLPGSGTLLGVAARLVYEELILPFRALRFDAVYAIADMASPLLPVPTVVALRNLNIYDHTYYDTFRLRLLERIVRLGIRRAEKMIFPTRAAAESISRRLHLPARVVSVVPHGVDAAAFVDPECAGSENGGRYLFLPAAVERHKNLEVLVDAIPHLSDPEIEIRVAGPIDTDPDYVASIRARARERGVDARFRLLGPVPYDRIAGYYRGASALVFPSKLETFGHPMLEAMLAGTPIVASDIPAFREIGEGVASFFSPDDPIALAQAVGNLSADESSTRDRVSRGRERAALYSWKRSTDALCEVLAAVVR